MNNVCPNCGIIGPNFSCPNHTYCWGTGNTQSPTIQPQVTWMPVSDQLDNSSLYAEIGRLNVLLNERDKEIARLKGLMPPDERGPGFVGQGSWSVFAEKVVAERDQLQGILAYLRSMKVIDGLNRILPLEGHHKDCGHGKDGWSLCTCDELKKADEERAKGHHPECGRAKPGMRSPCNCLGLYERDARNQRNLDRCFDDLVEDDKVTCDHGNTECKRCEVGQPTRDPRQDLKVGDIVRFEITGVITARQSAGIVKDYDGNDYEPIQYEIKDRDKRITNYVPYDKIINVIGKEK